MPDVEAFCRMVSDAFKPLLEKLGANVGNVKRFEVDFYGPRIIIVVEPECGAEISADISPDGVEVVYTFKLQGVVSDSSIEERIVEQIESSQDIYSALEEYDVAYDNETGELIVMLKTRMLEEQPPADRVRGIVRRAVAEHK